MTDLMDLAGQRYGRLIVVREAGRAGVTRRFECRCDCGSTAIVRMGNLRTGHTTSCGCYARESATTHGLGHSSEYQTWYHMILRCEDPCTDSYPYYGGRGIGVCDRWHKFENFLEDMGMKPSKRLTLDRVDNDGNYEPNNCRWATLHQQSRNRSSNRMLTLGGKTLCIRDWEAATGINYTTIWERLRRGWSVERSLTEQVRAKA